MTNTENGSRRFSEYLNPVYPLSFPDPYVLKFCGEYYAYATGHAPDGNIFQVLRSKDLVNWYEAGSAMEPLAESHPFYWAPEVFYDNGKFYLYYSVGNETLMHLRVAVSERPDGGFVDSGHQLTKEDFAIDAHVFVDTDGSKYLFYATDFLEHSHIGTGTVVDRLIDWFTLEGKPSVVTRAKFDWQVYDPKRIEKGGVRWHTVEGPAVTKRKGLYYEMFSGGNWQNTTYGVSFAKSASIITNDEWEQYADGERLLPILTTLPEKVVGPGHNSIVRGPNNSELFAVYHRWTDVGRVMAIDRLDFAGERMFITGATTTPQPAPFLPKLSMADLSNCAGSNEWIFSNDFATSSNGGGSLRVPTTDTYLVEANLKLREAEYGAIGIRLLNHDKPIFELSLAKSADNTSFSMAVNGRSEREIVSDSFDTAAFHLIRLEKNKSEIRCFLDGMEIVHERTSDPITSALGIFTEGCSGTVAGFSLTEGFEETFELDSFDGWDTKDALQIRNRELILDAKEDTASISRRFEFADIEVAAAVRLSESYRDNWSFELNLPGGNDGAESVKLMIDSGRPYIRIGTQPLVEFPALQDLYDWKLHYQFRIVKTGERVLVYIDDLLLGSYNSEVLPTGIEFTCSNSCIAIDSIRVMRL
jgi:GH43 family beta-xylosidase